MKFERIILEIEKYESLDIIAASQPTDPTDPTTPEVAKYDPYGNDKW